MNGLYEQPESLFTYLTYCIRDKHDQWDRLDGPSGWNEWQGAEPLHGDSSASFSKILLPEEYML